MKTLQLALFVAVCLVFSNAAGSFLSFEFVVSKWNTFNCSFPEPSVRTLKDSFLEPCKILKDDQEETYPLCNFFYRASLSLCVSKSEKKYLLTPDSINKSPFIKDISRDNLICSSFTLVPKNVTAQSMNDDICQKLCLNTTNSSDLKPICRKLAAAVCIFFGEEDCHLTESGLDADQGSRVKTTENTSALPATDINKTNEPAKSKTEAAFTSADQSDVKTTEAAKPLDLTSADQSGVKTTEAAKPLDTSSGVSHVDETAKPGINSGEVPSVTEKMEAPTTTEMKVADGKKSDPMGDKTTPSNSDDVTTTPKTDAGDGKINTGKDKSTYKTPDYNKGQNQNIEKTVKPSPSYVEWKGNKNQRNKSTEKPESPSSIGVESEENKDPENKNSEEAQPSLPNDVNLDDNKDPKNKNSGGEAQLSKEYEPLSSTDSPTDSEENQGIPELDKENELKNDDGENKDDEKISKQTKVNKIVDVSKASDGEEESGSGHFLAYFLTAVIICVSGYIVYHNKQKIMAFIIEGRGGSRGRQRSKGVKYTELKSNVEEVLPSLEKTATVKHFVY